MSRWWTVLLVVALSGCDLLDDSVVISESEGTEIVTKRLAALGYAPSAKDHLISKLEVCDAKTGGCEVVSFALDGWDEAHRVGFEYLGEPDPDFAAATGFSYAFWSDSLQDAIKTAYADDVILVVREVAHETRDLALGQLDDVIAARLHEYGVGE